MRKRLLISASALIGLAILFWSENSISHSFQNCIANERSHQSASNANKQRFVIGRVIRAQTICTIRLADAHNGFVAALAGIAVAVFTLTLKWSTDKLWVAQRNALEKIERAFVFIDGFNIEITTAADGQGGVELPERYQNLAGIYVTRLAIQPRWKNSGNTPTKKMTVRVNWYGPREPFLPDYAYKDPPKPFFLAPHAIEGSEFFEIPPAQELIDYELHYRGVRPRIIVWGRADYQDVFERKHFIEWCYELRFDRHQGERLRATLIQWGDYNRSDEES